MRLIWYCRRLGSMSAAEVAWRFKRLFWQVGARATHGWLPPPGAKRAPGNGAGTRCRFYGFAGPDPLPFAAEWKDRAIQEADRLLERRFQCAFMDELVLEPTINWNREYKNKIDTPLLFGPWMDYRDHGRFGDFKYFWELPRLQHLVTLAKGWYLSGNPAYAGEVMAQLRSFEAQCPYLLGVNWIMPMEAGIRLISLSWIAEFLKDYLERDAGSNLLLERLVVQHVQFVAGNYSGFSSANNHLLGEAAGVFVASLRFGHLEAVKRRREAARRILEREVLLQHHGDGVNKEQAIHYQLFAFYFLLLAGLLGRQNGADFPGEYWEALEKSAGFIAALVDREGDLPQIGDSDDGRAVVLSGGKEVLSLLAVAAVIWKRGDFKAKSREFDETAFWLLGAGGREEFQALAPDEGRAWGSALFREGGYCLLSSHAHQARVIFDCGPLGLGAIAAHGHADALSFILEAGGRPFLVDPGTYTYLAEDPYRNYFRSTAAHNTLRVDGADQSAMTGPFLWGRKAVSHLERWESSQDHDEAVGWHDGYSRGEAPAVHRRAIRLDKRAGRVLVVDTVSARGSRKVEQFFHFSPECEVVRVSERVWRATRDGRKIELELDPAVSSSNFRGSESPILGWYSDRYDRKVPSVTLVSEAQAEGDRTFRTEIRL
jgi:hypothetical protein